MTPFQPEAIPEEMRLLPNWVCWRMETRDGKQTKVPYNPRRITEKAKASDPQTWGSFTEALEHLQAGRVSGVGFQFGGTPYCGIDTDHKPYNGEIHPLALEIIEALDSYTEISPSGKGQHIIIRGEHPGWAKHKAQLDEDLEIEVYSEGRFFTITADVIQTPYIESRQEALDALLIRFGMVKPVPLTREASTGLTASFTGSDNELWERIWASSSGPGVRALADGDLSQHGGDRSRADFALCGHLAFWANGSPERMDAMFRQSGLMRDKWDTRHASDGSTYGQLTIQNVLSRWDGQGYDPTRNRRTAQPAPRQEWSNPELLIRGRQHLATAGSHGRTLNSYSALWQAMVHVITEGHTEADGATLTVTPYGMTELYAHAGGRPVDRRQQLGFLHGQGMCGPLIRQDRANPRSAWLLTVPANPAELPFSTAPRGSLPRLPVSAKPRAGGGGQSGRHTVITTKRGKSTSGHFLPFWTLFILAVFGESTASELSSCAGLTPGRIRQQLNAHPTLVRASGATSARLFRSVLTPQQVGELHLHLTAPDVERRRRRILEDRAEFHENKFQYLTTQGLHRQALTHFRYAERYRARLEVAA